VAVPNSINTNAGALVALSSLRSAASALDAASKQAQTGYRVADASDDASTFAVAQGIRANLQAYQAVQASLAGGVGLASVTQAALSGISDLVGNLQAKITQLADASISANQREIYKSDYYAMTKQIENFIRQASYNGANLIGDLATTRTFVADTSGGTLALTGQEAVFLGLGVLGNIDVNSASAAVDSLPILTTFKDLIDSTLATVSAEARALKLQSALVNSIVDAATIGLGAIVDADIGKAAASVQAIQVRRQLAVQMLSIANQQPSALLALAR
jgi:flagellin